MANIICSESKKRNMMRRDAEAPTGKNMAWHVSMVWTAATSTQLTSYHVHTHTLYSLSLSLTHTCTHSLSLSHTHTLYMFAYTHTTLTPSLTHTPPHTPTLSLSLSLHTHTHTQQAVCVRNDKDKHAEMQPGKQRGRLLGIYLAATDPVSHVHITNDRQAGRQAERRSDRRSQIHAIHSVVHNTCQTDALQCTQYILSFTTLVRQTLSNLRNTFCHSQHLYIRDSFSAL